jgi:hypothetical protein
VEARYGDLGTVADVMEPGGGFEEVGLVTEHGRKGAGLPGNALSVRPATREWLFQQLTCNFSCPGRHVVHIPDAMGGLRDGHGRIGIVWGRLVTTKRPSARTASGGI